MSKTYTMTEEQFLKLNMLLDDCYEFFEQIKATEMKKRIADFDDEVFEPVRKNPKKTEVI